MIKVLIVDDHEIMRISLREILIHENDIDVVGEVADGEMMFEFLEMNECDIILLDLNLPGRSGMELITDLKRKRIKSKVIILTICSDYRKIIDVYKVGASGFIYKGYAVNELVHSIRTVNSKGRYMHSAIAEKIAFNTIHNLRTNNETLTTTEFDVASLLNEGYDVSEIAKKMDITINAVIQIRKAIFSKLNIENTIQLVHYFKEIQLEVL